MNACVTGMASCGKTVTSALLTALDSEDHCCNDALVSMSCGLADGPRKDAAKAIAALMHAGFVRHHHMC